MVDQATAAEFEWFAYFPLLREVVGPTTMEDAREEAGRVGLVLGPYPKHMDKAKEERMRETKETREKKRTLIQHMLTELETPAKALTKWEMGFVESVGEQFDSRGTLSEKQMEILERIYSERTA